MAEETVSMATLSIDARDIIDEINEHTEKRKTLANVLNNKAYISDLVIKTCGNENEVLQYSDVVLSEEMLHFIATELISREESMVISAWKRLKEVVNQVDSLLVDIEEDHSKIGNPTDSEEPAELEAT